MANTIRGKATVSQNTQSQVIGITAPVPMGEWQATTPYLKLNVVRYNGASYIAKKQSTGVEPAVTTGWQEVWQVIAYDGGAVEPNGDYQEMTVGKATQAENDGTGKNIADQFSAIDEVIPSTASADNQLADQAFVNSSINAMAAFYITYNENGNAFPTRADLLNATTFYNAGKVRVPTTNDYATVLADESRPKGVDGTYPTTRYSYQGGTYPDGQWDFQYVVNNTSLTQAQVDAINSGITKELVEEIGKGSVTSVNGETGTVTITPANIGAVNKSGDTMTGNLMINKTNYWGRYSATARDAAYIYRVIPLVDITNDETSGTRYFFGQVDLIRFNANNVTTSAYVSIQKIYNQAAANISVIYTPQLTGRQLCKFIRNGRTYIGLCDKNNSGITYAVATGNHSGDVLKDGQLEIIEYYQSNTNTVLDSEIYNSLTTDLTYQPIVVNNGAPFMITNLPPKVFVNDTRNNSATDTSVFSPRAVTPFFSSKEMPTSDYHSGLDVQGWYQDSTNGLYKGWQLVGYAGNDANIDSGLYHRTVDRGRGTISNWKTILEIDPTALQLSTAYGWTMGTNTLALPSAGIYLVVVNVSNSKTLLVYDGNASASAWAHTSGSVDWIAYSPTASSKWTSSSAITRIAYKKLA